MAQGLLGGVLPAIYSGADQLKRNIYGLLTNPREMAERAGQSLLQSRAERQALMAQAFADPNNPLKVTNPQALNALTEQVMAGELGFAPAGITTFHASPYKFSKFDPTKVGTGEGNQAYGVGAGYVAQNPRVANEYFRQFTDVDSAPLLYKGKRVDTPWNDDISQRWADVIEKNKFNQNQVEDFQAVLGNLSQVNMMDDVKNVVRDLTPSQKRIFEKYIKPELTKPDNLEAYMYKVDVKDEILPKMLDWDKPILEQPLEVRRAIANVATRGDEELKALVGDLSTPDELGIIGLLPNSSGGQAYKTFSDMFGGDAGLSAELNKYGVTGIKYKDAFSRRDAPNPTYNFVPFNPDDMRILETTKGLLDE